MRDPLAINPESFFHHVTNGRTLVKQPGECETFFVRENTPVTFYISKATDTVSGISLLTEELLPGSVIPVHKHLNEDEYFFFSQGTGLIAIDDTTFPFKPGTAAFVPRNAWHGFKNSGDNKAAFSFGYIPAGFEGFFREIGTPKGQEFRQKPKEEFDAMPRGTGWSLNNHLPCRPKNVPSSMYRYRLRSAG